MKPDDLYNPEQILTLYTFVVEEWIEPLRQLLIDLGRNGLGARASIGRGHFEVVSGEPFEGFTSVPEANGFITLGHMIPAAGDPIRGYYKTLVKRGRLGEDRSHWPRVFKKPLVFLQPGSAFYESQTRRMFAGRMVTSVVPEIEDVVHCGIAMVLPVRLP